MANPWADLDPEPALPSPSGRRGPGALTVLARGARRRCPRCASGGLFVRWFRIRERCPTCGLRLDREEGGFLGAMALNYGFTAAVWLGVLIVWLVIDLPDLHVAALTVTSLAVAGLLPLVFWPTSKTLWASVDHLIDRTSPDHASREAADRASGNGGRR